MAKTRDYMDYLDNEIGIAPANSQEEFQAAETIVEIMKDHDLEPTIQEFDARPWGHAMPSILMVCLFCGILLAGIGAGIPRAIGLVLVVGSAVLLLVDHSGRDIFGSMGPKARSQNVIAVHRATGTKVTKGNRPIVIMAHYDTPHESPLFGRMANNQSLLKQASIPCVVIVMVTAVVQVMTFLPSGLRVVVWIAGLLVSLPLLILAICSFVERFSACTVGANDNKASVAALMALVDEVRPSEDRVGSVGEGIVDGGGPDDGDQDDAEVGSGQTIYGVRHGKDVLEQLGILPESCEIIYESGRDTGATQSPEWSDDSASDEALFAQQDNEDVETPDQDESYGEETQVEGETSEAAPEGEMPENDQWIDDEVSTDDQDTYEADAYAGDSQEEWLADEEYEQDGYNQEPWDAFEAQDAQPAGNGFATKVKNAFSSLKERIASRKDKTDIDIPRGDAARSDDFSEFEETDWGEDDWSESQYEPQEELRSINREDFVARRSAPASWEEESPSQSEDGAAYDGEYYDSGVYSVEDVEHSEDSPREADDHAYEDEGFNDGDAQGETSGYEDGDASGNVSRTSHDISHENGPDWSVVETEDDADLMPEEDQSAFVEDVYERDDDQQFDDIYDSENEDLADVQQELDDDQLVSALPRPRSREVSRAGDEPDSASQDASAGDSQGVDETVAPVDPDGLSWDDSEQQAQDDSDEVLPKDSRGLDTLTEEYDVYEEDAEDQIEEPEPIDDPTWGQTSYVPPRSSVARRATLYDVPNPSEDEVDPLGDANSDDDAAADGDAEAGVSTPQEDDDARQESNRARNWKGGAAVRSDLRDGEEFDNPEWADSEEETDDAGLGSNEDVVDGAEDVEVEPEDQEQVDYPDYGDLQESILRMGDDLLISHDIWFVAVGASSIDHAGAKAFLSNFRQDIRGAFLINLDCIGAGTPTVLTKEGLRAGRRADRRLVRLLTSVADDLHVNLDRAAYDWDETDATPAMRSRVRAVTIMGRDGNGLPALSHTPEDVPENVDDRQVASIVRVIAEAIRRS